MKRWYVATTYSGYENSVKSDIEKRSVSMNMTNDILSVLVPEETIIVEDKKGNKKEKVQKIFPGYVFIEMEVDKEMDENVWFMIRNTQKVTGFLGSSGGGTKPVPIPTSEMDNLLRRLGMVQAPKLDIEVGDKVIVIDGSFKDFVGEIATINEATQTVTLLIDLFGRSTSMDFPINQIKKC